MKNLALKARISELVSITWQMDLVSFLSSQSHKSTFDWSNTVFYSDHGSVYSKRFLTNSY